MFSLIQVTRENMLLQYIYIWCQPQPYLQYLLRGEMNVLLLEFNRFKNNLMKHFHKQRRNT